MRSYFKDLKPSVEGKAGDLAYWVGLGSVIVGESCF